MKATLLAVTLLFIQLLLLNSLKAGEISWVEPREALLKPDLVVGDSEKEDGVLIGRVNNVVVDSQGNFYVGDYGFMWIACFSDSGKFLRKFGSKGEGPGELMRPFVMAIDSRNRLVFAGNGGRVTLLDTEGTFLDEFTREGRGSFTYSLQFDSLGDLYVVAPDILNQQMIHVYTPQWKYLRSFGDTYAVGTKEDTRTEGLYASGFLSIGTDDALYYVQTSPYLLRKYKSDGTLVASTNQGVGEFVPKPPEVDYTGATIDVKYIGGSTGIVVSPNEVVITTAYRKTEEGETESLILFHDSQLRLLARLPKRGYCRVVGCDHEGRIFLVSRAGDVPLLTRYRLSFEKRVSAASRQE